MIVLARKITDATAALPPSLQGMGFMLLSTLFAVIMHTIVRFIADDLNMHAIEIYFWRQLLTILVIVPWFFRVGFSAFRTQRPGLLAIRGFINGLSGMSWFWALSLVPLAKATALNISVTLFTVVGAMVVLGEKFKMSRITALAVGFAGVLVIVRPGIETITFGIALILGSRILGATAKLIGKVLTNTENSAPIVAYSALGMAVTAFIPATFVWTGPTLEIFLWIGLLAGFGSLGQICLIRAYRLADVSAVEPLSFVRLIWAALFGFILFAEVPSIWTWIGGAMIFVGVTYLARSEAAEKDKAKPLAE